MSPPLLALAAALAYALNNFFSRLGLPESTPSVAVAVIATTNAVFLWGLALVFSPIRPIFSVHVWPFVLAGVFAPCLARNFLMIGYQRMGMARSDVIAGSMPFFALILAIVLIGERPSTRAILGTVGIVSGIALLSYKREEGKALARWSILFPLGAALFFSARDVTSKFGLQLIPFPMAAAAVTATTAALVLNFPYLFPKVRRRVILPKRSFWLFCVAGVLLAMAYLSGFMALKGGMVSQVAPLVSVFPIFSVALSFLFLQSQEKVTWKVGGGGILVVAGASIIWVS